MKKQVSVVWIILAVLLAGVFAGGYKLGEMGGFTQGYMEGLKEGKTLGYSQLRDSLEKEDKYRLRLPFSVNPFIDALPCTVKNATEQDGKYKTTLEYLVTVPAQEGEEPQQRSFSLTVVLSEKLDDGEAVLVYRQAKWLEDGVKIVFVVEDSVGGIHEVLASR